MSQKYGYTFKINSVCYCILKSEMVDGIVVVFRRESPGKAAPWMGRSIREN
jgi:hypothetical protein